MILFTAFIVGLTLGAGSTFLILDHYVFKPLRKIAVRAICDNFLLTSVVEFYRQLARSRPAREEDAAADWWKKGDQ